VVPIPILTPQLAPNFLNWLEKHPWHLQHVVGLIWKAFLMNVKNFSMLQPLIHPLVSLTTKEVKLWRHMWTSQSLETYGEQRKKVPLSLLTFVGISFNLVPLGSIPR